MKRSSGALALFFAALLGACGGSGAVELTVLGVGPNTALTVPDRV